MGATHWGSSPGLRPRSGGGSQSWVRPQDPQVGLISSSPRSGVSGARKFPRGVGRLSSAQMMDAFLLRLLPPPSGPFTSPPRCGGGRGPSHTLGEVTAGPTLQTWEAGNPSLPPHPLPGPHLPPQRTILEPQGQNQGGLGARIGGPCQRGTVGQSRAGLPPRPPPQPASAAAPLAGPRVRASPLGSGKKPPGPPLPQHFSEGPERGPAPLGSGKKPPGPALSVAFAFLGSDPGQGLGGPQTPGQMAPTAAPGLGLSGVTAPHPEVSVSSRAQSSLTPCTGLVEHWKPRCSLPSQAGQCQGPLSTGRAEA